MSDKPSLLDAMLADHVAGVTVDDVELGEPTPAPEATPRERDTPVETSPRTWAADPDAQIGGLRRGGVFTLSNGGPDVDGAWVVHQLILPKGAEPADRVLVAARPEGGPPYIKISEADFLEEIEIGNAVIVQRDARG